MVYIGAEEMITPLGVGAETNFYEMFNGHSGIALMPEAGFSRKDVYLAKIKGLAPLKAFESLIFEVLESFLAKNDSEIITNPRTLLLLSSTKGALFDDITDPFGIVLSDLSQRFNLANPPIVISNACISGVLAINAAGNYIKAGLYDHIVVIGCDVITDFIIYGFQSLFAVSEQPCAPFDMNRSGVTLGEGCGLVLISNSRNVFKEQPYQLLIGTSANDANHISGPSRTGEGLYRSVRKTLMQNGIQAKEIDFVSAHGTGTLFNDEMESIAFDRLGLSNVPMNSMKAYLGHTLGAAGVLETIISIQMLRNQILLKSLGFNESGTSIPLNLIEETTNAPIKTILKTASGFGGGNASLIIQEL